MSLARHRHRPWTASAIGATAPSLAMLFPLLLIGAPSTAAPVGEKHPSPEAILRLSIDASRKVNMRGTETVIVQPPHRKMVSMTRQVIHSKQGVTLTRWTDPPQQRGLVMLDDGAWSKCFKPDEGFIRVSRSTPKAFDERSAARLTRLILRNYRVTYEGMAPMANRSCYKLRLTPIHGISHTTHMWIDKENGVVLSHMETDSRGDTSCVSSFNGVEYPRRQSVADLRSALPAKAKHVSFSQSPVLRTFAGMRQALARKRAGFEFCPPYAMPAGYEFECAEIVSLKGEITSCLRYTDGMSQITIYQSRASSEPRPNGYRATHGFTDDMGNNVVELETGKMNFYLVGRCEGIGLLAVTDVLDIQKERSYLGYFARNYHLPMATLVGLRNQGMGVDTLDALLAISQQARMPLSTLVGLCQEGWGWAALARRFRADLGSILKHVRTFECR